MELPPPYSGRSTPLEYTIPRGVLAGLAYDRWRREQNLISAYFLGSIIVFGLIVIAIFIHEPTPTTNDVSHPKCASYDKTGYFCLNSTVNSTDASAGDGPADPTHDVVDDGVLDDAAAKVSGQLPYEPVDEEVSQHITVECMYLNVFFYI